MPPYLQCQLLIITNMSTYLQKSRRNILVERTIPPEQLYQDSNQHPNHLNDQDLQIQQLVQQQKHTLKPSLQKTPPKTIEKQHRQPKQDTVRKSALTAKKGREYMDAEDDGEQSQEYQPQNASQSDQDQNQYFCVPQERPQAGALSLLNFLIKKYEAQLSKPETKLKKINEIATILDISVSSINRRVADYFAGRKMGLSRSQERLEQQTIYKKTEMFDEAIKRVLKVTPYACINDLREEIRSKLNLDLAKETLIRRLKNLKFHYKKFAISKEERNDEQTIQVRKKFVKIFKEISLSSQPMFFFAMAHMALDECRGSMWMKSKDNGELDHILYEKDVLHIGIIASNQRIQFYHIYHGFYRHDSYADFMRKWVSRIEINRVNPEKSRKKQTADPRPAYLIVESNLIHNPNAKLETEVREYLLNEKILPIPFPSHSAQMNPAEGLFNQIKYVTRGKLKKIGIQELGECIVEVIEHNIDSEDIQFAFRKVEEVYSKY